MPLKKHFTNAEVLDIYFQEGSDFSSDNSLSDSDENEIAGVETSRNGLVGDNSSVLNHSPDSVPVQTNNDCEVCVEKSVRLSVGGLVTFHPNDVDIVYPSTSKTQPSTCSNLFCPPEMFISRR